MAGNDQEGLGAFHSYLAEVAAFRGEERSMEGLRSAESARDEGLVEAGRQRRLARVRNG
jgi:hypothetical protein